jgi:hypothetical protein
MRRNAKSESRSCGRRELQREGKTREDQSRIHIEEKRVKQNWLEYEESGEESEQQESKRRRGKTALGRRKSSAITRELTKAEAAGEEDWAGSWIRFWIGAVCKLSMPRLFRARCLSLVSCDVVTQSLCRERDDAIEMVEYISFNSLFILSYCGVKGAGGFGC